MARIGGVLRSLMLFMCGSALLGGAALILEPAALVAVTKAPQPLTASQRIHDEFAQTLAGLMSDCVEVLAVNEHSPTSQAAVVLWANDHANPGAIDPTEITVISHSQLLRTITVYTLDDSGTGNSALGTPDHGSPALRAGSDEGVGSPDSSRLVETPGSENRGTSGSRDSNIFVRGEPRPMPSVTGTAYQLPNAKPNALRLSAPLDREAIAAPVFCDRWRATPSVKPRTIGSGISDMRVEAVNPGQNDLSVLRLWLRWSPDSADGAGEATAMIVAGAAQKE